MSIRTRRPAPPHFAGVALFALLVAACGSSTPPLTDPVAILQAGAASLGEMRTVHVRGVIEGEVALELGGVGGGAPLPLKGTTLDADIDVTESALEAELIAPALFNLRVNLIVVGGSSYLRAPIITGDSWVRQPAEGGVGDALGSLGSSIPGLSGAAVGDVTVTVGVRKDNLDLATLSLEIPSGGTMPLTISLELTKVNEPVTIEAPPADQVKDAPGGPGPTPAPTVPTTG
jgi:hypothetical protein